MAKSKNESKKTNSKTANSKKKVVNKKSTKSKVVTTSNVVNKKVDSIKSSSSNEIVKFIKLAVIVLGVLGLFYLLTVVILDNGQDNKKTQESIIQYDEILAGSSFDMNSKEYYVVYYDYTDTTLEDLYTQVYNYTYSGSIKLYSVNMNDGFNKSFVAEESSNASPSSANELAIKGPTLIKFVDGAVVEYIEGSENIINKLK